jgi:signal transduction histidine kinase
MKAGSEGGKGPHRGTALKQLEGYAASNALDERISPRNFVRPRDRTAIASEPAGHRSIQSGRDERFLLHNGIVHDIKNVLQVLLSGIWVAHDRIRNGRAGEVPEVLDEIGEAVDRANALLRQLRIPPSPEKHRSAVHVGKLLARLNTSLRWALGPSHELVIAVAPDLPPIYCIESELENVVLNLVVNARDAMPTGGRVAIEAMRGARSNVVLRVHDTGVGMDIGVAAKAFDPYFTTKRATAGAGLGLAKAAAFARSIKGSVRIEHTSASGTTMALDLPAASRI